MALLSLSHLSAQIGRQVILDDISFDLWPGQVSALIGESGAGKSTILRCLTGLYYPAKPIAGHMLFADKLIDLGQGQKLPKQQGGIAFVAQNPEAVFDPLKKLSNQWQQAKYWLKYHQIASEMGEEFLLAFDLPPFQSARPYQWSRGMQQRLTLAMALLAKPRLLILDEPTSALDPILAAQIMTETVSYARKNKISILLVTHDLSLAAQFADHMIILKQGRIVEMGAAEKLLTSPVSQYGQLLVSHRYWNIIGQEGGNALN